LRIGEGGGKLPGEQASPEGFYKNFLSRISSFYDTIQDFTSSKLYPIARKISDSLIKSLDLLASALDKGSDFLLGKAGFSRQQHPEMNFMERAGEAFASIVKKGVDALLSFINTVSSFFKNLLPIIEAFSKAIVKIV